MKWDVCELLQRTCKITWETVLVEWNEAKYLYNKILIDLETGTININL